MIDKAPVPAPDNKPEEALAEQPEVIEPEGHALIKDITPTMSVMDQTILVASKLEEYRRARNSIMNFIIKESYPNDWVSHSMESVPKLDRTANLGAAGCERIASLLGIKEYDWTVPKKEWTDNRLHYTYVTEADFEFAGRRIHVSFRVGTRDKFWRTEYKWDPKAFNGKGGKVKSVIPLEDVREDYIEKASFRGARKEGIRTLMGLRNIPLLKLKDLGFEIEHVHYASFKPTTKTKDEGGKVIGGKAAEETTSYTLTPKNISLKRQGKRGPFFVIEDESGDKFYLHVDDNSKRLALIREACMNEEKVLIKFREENGYKSIEEANAPEPVKKP